MTSAEFIARVKVKLQFNKVDFTGADTILADYLPFSLQRLWNVYPWDEKRVIQSVSIVSGDYSKDLATNIEQVTNIVFKGTKILPPISVVSESEFKSMFPNVAQDYSAEPSMASILYDSTTQKTTLLLAPKSNGSYTLEVTGRRKVPTIDEVPAYLLPTLEKMLIEDITIPKGDNASMSMAQDAQREAATATNITPKAVSIKPTMEAGIDRDGRHRFNMSEGIK